MFDVNCAIGHWPFRKLTRNTVGELRDYLRSCGVTGGALTHNHAVCYVNAQDANARCGCADVRCRQKAEGLALAEKR